MSEESLTPAQWAERLQGPPGGALSTWDRMDWSSSWLERVAAQKPTPMPIVRMWLRTELTERAWRANRAELRINDEGDAEYLAQEITRRRTAWAELILVHRKQGPWDAFLKYMHVSRSRFDRVFARVLQIGATLAVIAIAYALSIWIAVGVLILLPIAAWRNDRRWRRAHLARTSQSRLCGCGYDTTGVPSDLPEVEALGVIIGPRLCPECGAAWPLIPPPAL